MTDKIKGSDLERASQSGFFNLSSIAQQRVADKRKRKGLGEIKKREQSVYGQFFKNGISIAVVNTTIAPIERLRIIQQTRHMINTKSGIPNGTVSTLSQIIKSEGVTQLWRGNMPNIYHSSMNMFTRVLFYDRIKNYFMPYDQSKYSGFDWLWRITTASFFCQSIGLFFTYPLELIHTRMCADMTQRGQSRLFTTTFDCFNRTNLDETRYGLYKGADIVVASAVVRSLIQLPIYEFVKRKSDEKNRFQQRIGSAMVSGLLLSLILYPLDTAKRCMMLNGGRGFLQLYKNSLDCAFKMPLTQMYAGAHLYLATSVLASLVQFTILDMLTK